MVSLLWMLWRTMLTIRITVFGSWASLKLWVSAVTEGGGGGLPFWDEAEGSILHPVQLMLLLAAVVLDEDTLQVWQCCSFMALCNILSRYLFSLFLAFTTFLSLTWLYWHLSGTTCRWCVYNQGAEAYFWELFIYFETPHDNNFMPVGGKERPTTYLPRKLFVSHTEIRNCLDASSNAKTTGLFCCHGRQWLWCRKNEWDGRCCNYLLVLYTRIER